MSEPLFSPPQPIKKKDLPLLKTLADTKLFAYELIRQQCAEQLIDTHQAIESTEHLIPPNQLLILRAWFLKQTDTYEQDQSLLQTIDARLGWNEELLRENPTTHSYELHTRFNKPTDISRKASTLTDPKETPTDKATQKRILKHTKTLIKKFEQEPFILATLTEALSRATTLQSNLSSIKEYLGWCQHTQPLIEDTPDVGLLREELRHTLDLIDLTPQGIAQGEETDIASVQEVLHRIQKAGQEQRRHKEAVHRLKLLKLQLASDFNDVRKKANSFKRVYGERIVASEEHTALTADIERYHDALKKSIHSIDAILEENDIMNLDLKILETELLRDVNAARETLEASLKNVYRDTPSQKPVVRLLQSTVTRDERRLHKTPDQDSFVSINEQEAKNLGLIRLELQGYPKAQSLIDQITSKQIDIQTPQGRNFFVTQWQKENPSLPLPCVPDKTGDYTKGGYWFLGRLQEQRIIKNTEGTPTPTTTHYETNEVLYVDNWQEDDWDNKTKSLTKKISPLLKQLLNKEGVIEISRNQIDQALFQGDPSQGIKTLTHTKLLTQLNLDPEEYSFRLISYDEYARGAEEQHWGQKNLFTHFNEYRLREGGDRSGLYGGCRVSGGASCVYARHRVRADVYLAVRLVLARIPLK